MMLFVNLMILKENKMTEEKCERDELLNCIRLAYRKHCQNDDSIGWDELDKILLNTLCNAMGDDKFNEWLNLKGE